MHLVNKEKQMSKSIKFVAAAAAAAALLGGAAVAPAQAATPTINIATEGTYAPFSYVAGGKLTGYDIEVANAVAKQAGYKIVWKQTTWDGIFAGLDAKRWDAIANQVTITEKRKATYTFTAPYTLSTEVAVTRTDSTKVTKLAELKGLTAAQSATSNFRADAVALGANIETVPSFTEALALVTAGRVDVTLNDKLAVLDYITNNKNSGLKIAAELPSKDAQGIVFLQGSKYAAPFTKALNTLLKNGAIAKISKKYFGTDVTK
jgi:cystine transport system substrate-binding protein